VLDAEVTHDEERCASAPCLCGYTRAWCQEGDEEHGPVIGAMQLGSARWTTQRRSERADLSGVRRHDGKLAAT
jgi:hypothetical protein